MVGLVLTLAYSVILGRDWHYFGELLAKLVGPLSSGQGPLPPAPNQPEDATLVGVRELAALGEGISQSTESTRANQAPSQPGGEPPHHYLNRRS